MAKKRKLAVIDTETDPFKYGLVPKPFVAEFHSDEITKTFWGNDCIEKLVAFLESLDDEYMIYAHNGGKFDFMFMAKFLENPIRIIKSRIVEARIGKHILRDSYSIYPMPLAAYQKTKFDYSWMERHKREKYKKQILEYLHDDCVYLLQLVVAFVDRFGPKLTIGSTAMGEAKKLHPFEIMSGSTDAYFRNFYYGGRVQCFESGILPGPWKMFDVNSMYPKAMRDYRHPRTPNFDYTRDLPDLGETFFIRFRGKNRGALPVKTKTGLSFDVPEGEFYACSHELRVALKYDLVDIDEIIVCAVAVDTFSFQEFVDKFYAEKVAAKIAGDKIGEIHAKLMLNSAYGKFGQNPADFEDWRISSDPGEAESLEDQGYRLAIEYPEFELWSRPTEVMDRMYYNVSVAASVTSAARSMMLEGIKNAVRPVYCDTDSLICQDFTGAVSATELGAWKFEGEREFVAIGGKKLYAFYDETKPTKPKLVSKGGSLSLEEIQKICQGGEVLFKNDAPTFSLHKEPYFVSRTFRSTIDKMEEMDL